MPGLSSWARGFFRERSKSKSKLLWRRGSKDGSSKAISRSKRNRIGFLIGGKWQWRFGVLTFFC